MARGHTCWRCRLADVVTDVLAGPDGAIPARLRPLAEAIMAMPRPNSGYVWLRKNPRVRALLRGLATGEVALTHEALDTLPNPTTVDYVRGLLITHGVLPARDHYLAAFERWLTGKLDQIADVDQRRLIDRYARWHLLRRLRQQARTAAVSLGAFLAAKQSTTVATGLLAWLDERGTPLSELTQHDVDQWFAGGPTTRQHAVRFLGWALQQRLIRGVTAARTSSRTSPTISEDERREHLRRVLLEDTLTISHRVIAVLVLLFGQALNQIVRLQVEDVVIDGDRTLLRLAHDTLEVPEPAATLLRGYLADPRYRRNTAAHIGTPWLFPGLMPGRPMHLHRAAKALRDLGIPPGAARTGTWLQLVRQAPPSVLAEALGISPETAMRHACRAGADYLAYPGLKQDPQPPTGELPQGRRTKPVRYRPVDRRSRRRPAARLSSLIPPLT